VYLRIAAVQLVSHDVARTVASGNPAPTLEVHAHNTAVDGPNVSGCMRRNHRSHFPPPHGPQGVATVVPTAQFHGALAVWRGAQSPLTQANTVPTIPLLSAIIRHLRLRRPACEHYDPKWYVHPRAASERANLVDWPEMVDTWGAVRPRGRHPRHVSAVSHQNRNWITMIESSFGSIVYRRLSAAQFDFAVRSYDHYN